MRCLHAHHGVTVRGSYDVTAMCLRATGLRFSQFCHCAELNKIVEAMMPVIPYDDHKVSLRRPQGNGDLDIVRASYTRRKANVTEAYAKLFSADVSQIPQDDSGSPNLASSKKIRKSTLNRCPGLVKNAQVVDNTYPTAVGVIPFSSRPIRTSHSDCVLIDKTITPIQI